MFRAPHGIVARYRDEDTESLHKPHTNQRTKPVFAFTDNGEPMVIGDDELGHSLKLVRADTYSNYAGIAYIPAGFLDESDTNAAEVEYNSPRANAFSRLTPTSWEIAAVEFAALRALELVGKRLLTRPLRGELRDLPTWEIHTRVSTANPDKVLNGAYDLLRTCLPGHDEVYMVIDSYVRERLATRTAHDRFRLLAMLADAGCFSGSD